MEDYLHISVCTTLTMTLKLIQLWLVSFIHGFSYSIQNRHKLMLHKHPLARNQPLVQSSPPCCAASQDSVQVKAAPWLMLSPISVSPAWNCICWHIWAGTKALEWWCWSLGSSWLQSSNKIIPENSWLFSSVVD